MPGWLACPASLPYWRPDRPDNLLSLRKSLPQTSAPRILGALNSGTVTASANGRGYAFLDQDDISWIGILSVHDGVS